jgi:hypothetical protein
LQHKDESITVDVSGDDDVAMEAMVHFFYHGDYYPSNYIMDEARFDADSGFHHAVLQVALAYGVNDLQILATELKEKAIRSKNTEEIRVARVLEQM